MLEKFNFMRKKNGQVLILAVFAMVLIMGSAAFVIDVGLVASEKARMQNAADAAAMAAVMDLPNTGTARTTAKSYAMANGVDSADIEIITPYDGDANKIKVKCKKNVPHTFAKVLGFTSAEVIAEAVAKNSPWDGDALPFINLEPYSDDLEIDVWNKISSGDFESIDDFEVINDKEPDVYFKLNYMDGVELKKGTVATVKQEIGFIYDRVSLSGDKVYLISLKNSVVSSNKVLLTDGTLRTLSKTKEGDVIDPSQLILLECTFDDYDIKKKTLKLTVKEDYDFNNDEFPPDYVPADGGGSMLIN